MGHGAQALPVCWKNLEHVRSEQIQSHPESISGDRIVLIVSGSMPNTCWTKCPRSQSSYTTSFISARRAGNILWRWAIRYTIEEVPFNVCNPIQQNEIRTYQINKNLTSQEWVFGGGCGGYGDRRYIYKSSWNSNSMPDLRQSCVIIMASKRNGHLRFWKWLATILKSWYLFFARNYAMYHEQNMWRMITFPAFPLKELT